MSETATLHSSVDERILDELVPPPGPLWRRAAVWLAFLGLVAAVAWATTTGTVIPQVATNVTGWGGFGPVGITSEVTNNSRVDIELMAGPRPRPGLSSIGYTTGPLASTDFVPAESPSNPFPLRLAPGESVDLTAWYDVTDCQAIADIDTGDNSFDLQVRIADGPASWFTAERNIDAGSVEPIDAPETSWPAGVARRACSD